MFWFIVFALMVLQQVVNMWRKGIFYRAEVVLLGISALLCALILASVTAFSVGALVGAQEKQWVLEETEEIIKLVSLRDQQGGAAGRFMLGTGTIGNADYYYFYKEVGDGYQADKVRVGNNATIFERKSEAEKQPGSELKIRRITFKLKYSSWFYFSFPPNSTVEYQFFIPQGSLKKSFSL